MFNLLVLIGIFFVYWLHHEFIRKRRRLPPGPIPLPILGNVASINPENPLETLEKWAKEFGPVFTIWLANQPNVIISDYALIKEHVGGKDGDAFVGRPTDNHLFAMMTRGKFGIILNEGEGWKEQRRFSLQILRDFGFGRNIMEARIIDQVNQLQIHIQKLMKTNGTFVGSVSMPLNVCVANIINLVAYGRAFSYDDDPEFAQLKMLLSESFELFARPDALLMQQSFWLRHLPYFRQTYHRLRYINETISGWIWDNIQDIKSNMDYEKPPTNFSEAYLQEAAKRKDNPGYFNDWQLSKITGDIWAAGMETTLTTLNWALLYLTHHPDVQQKMHDETVNIFDQTNFECFQMKDRAQMPYSCAVITEIQRVANIFPLNLQHRTTRDIWVGGQLIPNDTVVIPQIGQVHRDSSHFSQPDRFNPQRFLTDEGKLRKVEEVVPFSVGKRSCLGESLARMELFLILTSLMHKFKFEMEPGAPKPSLIPLPGVTTSPHPYHMLITLRK